MDLIGKSLSGIPRIHLVDLPTPFMKMENLTKSLDGPNLYIKRDDVIGGNKMRKLEFYMADAKKKNAHTVITYGFIQSNHAREVAVAANKIGMKTILILAGEEPKEYQGNLLLDKLLGAEIRIVAASEEEFHGLSIDELSELVEKSVPELMENLEGYYSIPPGAYKAIGGLGYFLGMLEIYEQAKKMNIKMDHVFVAVGTGGTYSGLLAAAKALNEFNGENMEVTGILVGHPYREFEKSIADRAKTITEMLGLNISFNENDVNLHSEYVGEGYAIPTEECVKAIKIVAVNEGIFLDPVYTGKAMAGLIDMIKKKRFKRDENIVFLHTGGEPAVYAYNKIFF